MSPSSSLVYNDTVKRLGLTLNKIGPRGTAKLAAALKSNKTRCTLDLSGNQIGEDGAEALMAALSFNACITSLDLFACGVSNKSMTTLEYLTKTRNAVLIPAAVRRAFLFLITIRGTVIRDGMGDFATLPRGIVRMIAMEIWSLRRDPIWIHALK